MQNQTEIIAGFVKTNGPALSQFLRQKLKTAGATSYLAGLGKDGMEALEAEAAGVIFELALALYRRIEPEREYVAEIILETMPLELKKRIRLPRSAAYHGVMDSMAEIKKPNQ